jgi:hypothetical protein
MSDQLDNIPQEATELRSSLNQMAALRITQRFGPHVLKLFLDLEKAMKESGGSSFTGNICFMEPGDPTQAGELIPSIHLSLQPHYPILSVPIEIESEDEDNS